VLTFAPLNPVFEMVRGRTSLKRIQHLVR